MRFIAILFTFLAALTISFTSYAGGNGEDCDACMANLEGGPQGNNLQYLETVMLRVEERNRQRVVDNICASIAKNNFPRAEVLTQRFFQVGFVEMLPVMKCGSEQRPILHEMLNEKASRGTIETLFTLVAQHNSESSDDRKIDIASLIDQEYNGMTFPEFISHSIEIAKTNGLLTPEVRTITVGYYGNMQEALAGVI